MTTRKKRWLIGTGTAAALAVIGVFVAGSVLSRRFEPYVRQQAIQYLSERFDSDVQLEALHIHVPNISPLRLILLHGRGGVAAVEGESLSLRYHGAAGAPPLLRIRKFRLTVGLDTLFQTPKVVPLVVVNGMEINIPPKGQRPHLNSGQPDSANQPPGRTPSVLIQQLQVHDTALTILPRDPRKNPLRFEIADLKLHSAGARSPMKYEANLSNPKPPGHIQSTGTFGPWNTGEPGDTPLAGDYTFDHADLGVFNGIAGILHSRGQFDGQLSALNVNGEADVPDFRLKRSGNRVPLATRFQALVDGTNGNTILQPVNATLGRTNLTTSGGVIQHEPNRPRAINLDANIPDGDMRDVLRLAMPGEPFMEGRLRLKTKIAIPPLSGPVREKLKLDGRFEVFDGKFLRSTIQNQLDGLSRRARGQPENQEIDEVVSHMAGAFQLSDELLHFSELSFGVPGARIHLAGDYDMNADRLNFLGNVRLQAKVSETMTGWKRVLLKPIDPFFSKNGAGTFLRIKVEGTAKSPKFGLAFGKP
jgi:hypothetical protein